MIKTHQLTKKYEEFLAVRGISLAVGEGELVALLGPNGAGKTTTIRMMSAILQPTSGWARINGHDVVQAPQMVHRSIGVLTEQPGLYERMTSLEYLLFYGRLYGLNDSQIRQRGLALLNRFGMGGTETRRIGEYSKGMKQKVGLIRAMLHDPAVLLLDEPTSAMDPHSAKQVRDAIAELRRDKRAILLCTHNLVEAETLADRIAIINEGQVVAQGTAAELKRQYLGDPLMELTLTQSPNGQLAALEQLVQIEQVQGNQITYRTAEPHITNPQLVRQLAGLGLEVFSLTPIPQSLEEVYLRVVAKDEELY
jgi:ABC-2 type transport system ATP-binding protein